LILVDDATGQVLARGYELEPFPEERDKPDEDELEILYPTQRQFFQFTESSPTLQVRSTSFGCSKMGHQIWPSSMALCLSLIHDYHHQQQQQQQDDDPSQKSTTWPRSVLELGAGCGLPSILCRDVLQIPRVVATDFWYPDLDPSQRISDRLIPEVWHGINLAYNVQRLEQGAIVRPLDWHDLDSVRQAATPSIDLVIASDVVYYHMDIEPLWNTMNVLLRECGAAQVVLVLPVKPETRESLPMFVELLEAKAASGAYRLDKQNLHLYKSQESFDARQDSDRFLKFTLALNS
jgi:predicted nicotinamide N-methyase